MRGTIFDIQRFSVHDGPGIRTTVFMKGCPLRCKWCHNPEGLSPAPQLRFEEEKCIGCGKCGDRTHLEDAQICPTTALTVCGRDIDEDEVIREILKDSGFYGEHGGVTFSGGECLLQADFVASVLSKVKGLSLHTAIDTSGCVPWRSIEKTLPFCDLYLYDIKCIAPENHKEFTGVDNAQILANIQKLSQVDKEIWVRVPIIPDFNDNEPEIEAIAGLVSVLPRVSRVTLMPYHTLGASKYPTLGLTYPYNAEKRISEASLSRFCEIFTNRGIPIC